MQAVFSLIENIPTIHKIHPSEASVMEGWIDIVIKYISEKRGGKSLDKLTVPLSEITLETFQEYPVYSYIVVDDKNVEIYLHNLIDRVEKGWIWNGKTKGVESTKVGYFQILPVQESCNLVEQDKPHETVNSGLDLLNQSYNEDNEVTQLLNKIMDEIHNTKSVIEKEIEDLPEDILDTEPMDFSGLPPLLDFSEKSYDKSIYSKRNMYNYETILFPEISEQEECEKQEIDLLPEQEYKEHKVDTEENKSETNPIIIPKYYSSQRGLRGIRRNMGRLGMALPGRYSHCTTQLKKYKPYLW